jgi:Zn-dependent protease with chaperone function
MIKKILIALTCIATCAVMVQAATPEEYNKVFNEAIGLCSVYKKKCTIEVIENQRMRAQTGADARIQVSTELLRRMNEAQVRGAIFHEVGHAVMEHVETTSEHIAIKKLNGTFDQEKLYEYMRANEYRADRFAVLAGFFTFKDVNLKGALTILTPPEEYYNQHKTHPSTADRIKAIDNIFRGF